MKRIAAFLITLAFVASTGIVFNAPVYAADDPVQQEEKILKERMKSDIKRIKEAMKGMSKEDRARYKKALKKRSKYYKELLKEMEK